MLRQAQHGVETKRVICRAARLVSIRLRHSTSARSPKICIRPINTFYRMEAMKTSTVSWFHRVTGSESTNSAGPPLPWKAAITWR